MSSMHMSRFPGFTPSQMLMEYIDSMKFQATSKSITLAKVVKVVIA